MSDFLGRLAAKAIGSDAMLMPRLPSLFEPLQHAPIMPSLSADADAQGRHDDSVVQAIAPPVATTVQPSPASSRSESDIASTSSGRVPLPAASFEVVHMTRNDVQPVANIAAPASPSTDDQPATPSVRRHQAEASAPTPVQPQRTRVASEQHGSAIPPRTPAGTLLPTPALMLPAARAMDMPNPASRASASRARAAPSGNMRDGGSSAPVVHVSIGRLEVRAAPTSAAPARRRDGPQPSSLDDYLRQRGGKATP
jgi:hypothetical protein